MILHRGRRVAAHFAHKENPCEWDRYTTQEHVDLQYILVDEFRRRYGFEAASLEVFIGRRKADVLVRLPEQYQNERVKAIALEAQRANVDHQVIEERTRDYTAQGVRVLWIPFLRDDPLDRYPVSGFLLKLITYYRNVDGTGAIITFYDPKRRLFRQGTFEPLPPKWKEERYWYDKDGNERYQPGEWFQITAYWRLVLDPEPLLPSDLRFDFKKELRLNVLVGRWKRQAS
jgi:hypothetical protein